jgi:hypothetical protein
MIAEGWVSALGGNLIDMLPKYTEQWATTYLQVLFQSFLFALGVPTALYSLIIDNDIKRVAQTRVKFRRYFYGTAMLYAAVLIIVWLLHPSDAQESPAAGQVGPAAQVAATAPPPDASVTAAARPVAPPNALLAVADGSPPPASTPAPQEPPKNNGQAAQGRSATSIIKSVVAAAAVTLLPLIVLLSGYRLNNKFKRETVVANLAEELLARLDADRSIDTVALKDLSYLGEHGRAGEEKEVVLNIIDELVETVQKRVKQGSLDYHGHELDSLIRHIPEMLDNPTQPGNDQNFTRAVEVLVNIWRWLGPNSELGKVTDDSIATRAALRHLALYSVEKMAEATSHNYLEIAAECDSHMVFEMALAAIKAGRYPLAIAALGKLESLAGNAVTLAHDSETIRKYGREQLESVAKETKGNLLGIAASLAADSPSGALRAEKILHDNEEIFSPTIRHALADAFVYHSRAGYLDIADKVMQLSAEAVKMKTIDLDRNTHYGA